MPTSRIFSEQDIEDFLNHFDADNIINNNNNILNPIQPPPGDLFSAADGVVFDRVMLAGTGYSSDLTTHYKNQDNLNRFSRCGGMIGNPVWTQNLSPNNSTVMKNMDSQSSVCAESPISVTNPKQVGSNAVEVTSDYEQSDDDTEIEAGQCEQSNDQMDIKRQKRMVSNRESARRSRKRKQNHLTELEQQVELMRVEYSGLFKQLTNASHQFKDASTNNRVLKSEVEALRAKVKLAEDMLARGPLTSSSLSHLLENHLTTSQLFNYQNMSRMGMGMGMGMGIGNVSPTITVRGDDHGPHPGLPVPGQDMMVGLGSNLGIFDGNVQNGMNSDGGSCVSNIWSV